MPSRGQQLGKLLNPTGDIVETSLPPKIETFSQSVSNTGKVEKAALGNDVSTIEQVSDISLLTASGNSVGDQRVVGNNLYIWNGSGWFRIALINETPTWDSGGQPLSSYDLSSDSPQTTTTITLAATDPDGFPINYSYVTGGSMDSIATVSQDSSVFTITPKTSAQVPDGGTGTITFRASDGVNILPQVSSFSLSFGYSFEANLTASDGGYQDHFGGAVAISNDGNTMAVGAINWDGSYTNEGAVYVFTRSGTTWTEQTKLYPTQEVPNAGGSNPYFGSSVSISNDGNSLLVGMQNESITMGNNTGAALFYTRSGSSWTRQQIIVPPSYISGEEQFGKSSHISGDGNTIVIGSYLRDSPNLNSGSVFVYNRSGNTFSLDTDIVGLSQTNVYWAEDLCISDDGLTFIGNARGVKKSFIVEKTGGSWPSSLTGTGVTDFFLGGGNGYVTSVTISGDGLTAAAGALGSDMNGLTNNGRVAIYKKSGGTWSLEHSIIGTQDGGFFGGSLSLSTDGNKLIIGEHGKTVGAEIRAGNVYVYTRSGSTWSLDSVINDPDPQEYTYFGDRVDISGDGNNLVIGAGSDDGSSTNTSYNSGSVFIFKS